jgi:hypothetical protein
VPKWTSNNYEIILQTHVGETLFEPPTHWYLNTIDLQVPNGGNGNPMVGFYSVFMDSQGKMNFYGSTDSINSDSNLYFNRREGNKWVYDQNVPVITFTTGITSTAMGSVLHDTSAPFNGYECVMYFTNQPRAPISNYWDQYGGNPPCIVEEPSDVGWGLLYVSYSHAPDSGWTTPCQFSLDGIHAVKIEQVSAFVHNGTIYLTLLEGDFGIMNSNLNTLSYGYMVTASTSTPARGTRVGTGYFSMTGITGFNPNITLTSPNATDDHPVLFNLDTAFDPNTNDFYLTRSYSYPFDVTGLVAGEVPCNGNSPYGMGTYPNRSQLYKMNIGNPPDFDLLYSGTWQMLADYGGSVGYATSTNGGTCSPASLVKGQTDLGADIGTMSILRTEAGSLHSSKQLVASYGSRAMRKPFLIRKGF